MTTEEQFEEIAEDAIKRAEAVGCGFSEFVDGLRAIQSSVKERADLAQDELSHMDEETGGEG